jgi:hypothetical protein
MDKMVEFLGDLKDTIVTGIQNWVIDTVIKTAIPKLLSMFTPAGAIVQAALSIYNTIMFFVEKAEQIAALVQSVLDSLANIASGAVDAAIGFIERSMAKAVPLVINFLARWLGLGNVSAKIRVIIQKVQAKVDVALEKVAAWIGKMPGGGTGVAAPAGAIASGTGKPSSANQTSGASPSATRPPKANTDNSPSNKNNPGVTNSNPTGSDGQTQAADNRSLEQKKADVHQAVVEARQFMKSKDASPEKVRAQLPSLKNKFRLASIELIKDGEINYYVDAKVNPEEKSESIPLFETVDIPLPGTDRTIACAKKGSVLVPLGKVEVYAMGKVSMYPKEELRSLQDMKQRQRREFDRDPENEAKLEKIKGLKHNYERSQEMLRSIESIGIIDSVAGVRQVLQHLLDAGQDVTLETRQDRSSTLEGSIGKLKVLSTWKILPDESKYLSTIKFIPERGS